MEQNDMIMAQRQRFDSPYKPAQIIQGLRHVEDTATGELWFVARDVCARLGTEAEDIPKILDQDEYRSLMSLKGIPTIRGMNNLTGLRKDTRMLSEPGLYALIFRSRKPEAEKFQDWVFDEVLPSIRKYGYYFTPQKAESIIDDPDLIIELALQLKADRERQARQQHRSYSVMDVTPSPTADKQ